MGQNPAAADSLGVNVDKIRYFSVCLGAALAGIAGASLSISLLNLFQENMTAGMGFIAVALVYFGGWRPVGIMWGALLFSTVNSIQLWMQVLGVNIPSGRCRHAAVPADHRRTGVLGQAHAPAAALNVPFERGTS